MEGNLRSAVDMGRSGSNREVSKKYISYLNQWDGQQQRRLKKSVDAAPADNAAPQPGYLNGVKVVRKGRGQPPAERQEQLWCTNGRKEIHGKSHAASPGLLTFQPSTPATPLTSDETRTRTLRKATNRFNQSSIAGSSMMVAEAESTFRPCRGKGSHNPGHGISERMAKTLAYTDCDASRHPR